MSDPADAFVPGTDVRIEGRVGGPLADLKFAAKDLFDIAGVPTGAGNPDWPRAHETPSRHAWVVETLLNAGANLVGKTITDEISLGLLGENAFDGTPRNHNAPGRVPGGSSSGSAAAVAAGLCDFALGTDTGGSTRVPASFCGLYGIRTTHGRLDRRGMVPQAPGSDTIGWLACDPGTFARVAAVLFGERAPVPRAATLIIATDAFAFAGEAVSSALQPLIAALRRHSCEVREEVLAIDGLEVWAKAQRTLQMAEAWQTFTDWVDKTNPRFSYSVARVLVRAAAISEADLGPARVVRQKAQDRLAGLLGPNVFLCLPTTPFPAPPTGEPLSVLDPLREQITCLCCPGGLAGVPQVSIPGATIDGLPIGLSIVGSRFSDSQLVAVAQMLGASGG